MNRNWRNARDCLEVKIKSNLNKNNLTPLKILQPCLKRINAFFDDELDVLISKKIKGNKPDPVFYENILIIFIRPRDFWNGSNLEKSTILKNRDAGKIAKAFIRLVNEIHRLDTGEKISLLKSTPTSQPFDKNKINSIRDLTNEALYIISLLSSFKDFSDAPIKTDQLDLESFLENYISQILTSPNYIGPKELFPIYRDSVLLSMKTKKKDDPFLMFSIREFSLCFREHTDSPNHDLVASLISHRFNYEISKDNINSAFPKKITKFTKF